jgi:capsular polysaccharide biosynthesis protein
MLHLQNILPLLKQHKKFIFLFTFLITIGTGLLLFFIPPEYKSVATLTPLNPQLADKGTLFNPNIKDLYSIFGNGDDIERMEAANDWNSIYSAIVIECKLDKEYGIKDADSSIRIQKAVKILRKKLYAEPTEKGMLQLIAWSKNPDSSKKLVNAFRSKIGLRIQSVFISRYDSAIKNMKLSYDSLQKKYIAAATSSHSPSTPQYKLAQIEVASITKLLEDNFKITGELEQAKSAVPQILFVLDAPEADKTAFRPDKPIVLLGTFLAALIFSMAWVIIYHRNNQA